MYAQMVKSEGTAPAEMSPEERAFQDRIDRGEIQGVPRAESAELRRARGRIRELEREVEILRVATNLLGQEAPHPKGFTR